MSTVKPYILILGTSKNKVTRGVIPGWQSKATLHEAADATSRHHTQKILQII